MRANYYLNTKAIESLMGSEKVHSEVRMLMDDANYVFKGDFRSIEAHKNTGWKECTGTCTAR